MRNAFKKDRFSAATFLRNSGKNGGILEQLDMMDDKFASLVQQPVERNKVYMITLIAMKQCTTLLHTIA